MSDKGDDAVEEMLLGAGQSAHQEGCLCPDLSCAFLGSKALLEHSPSCRTEEQAALG